MIGSVGASEIAVGLLIAAVCVACALFLIAREEYRRAMLAEKSGDDAPGDGADCFGLPSDFGDQPNVNNLFHFGTVTRKGR